MDNAMSNASDTTQEVTIGSDHTTIAGLDKLPVGTEVNFHARISTQRQVSKNLDFILLRDHLSTVQGVLSNDYNASCRVRKLSPESLILVNGTLREPPEPIRSATLGHVEVDIHSVQVLNVAHHPRISNYMPPETLRNRMASRILDLRNPANIAISRIRSLIVSKFREMLLSQDFVEIYTPKLQATATESGAATFKVDYFGRTAVLAQSPQLAKQMAISADLKRVFEIGPVFRAENSNTHRHLCEYTGLDIEMVIEHDYHEIIRIIDATLKAIFKAVYQTMTIELAAIQQRWPSKEITYLAETLILDHSEGLRMLRDDGRSVDKGDLSTANEIRLGQLVKEKHGTDYFILDKFPANIRPFYTAKDPDDPKYTRSFDIFIRGQEICTGGQRIHKLDELRDSMRSANVSEVGMKDYMAAFELGAPAHGGAGLGLERILTWMLELGDVRYSTLFYRDPKSLPETPPGLRHPEADTTKAKPDELPKLEHLVANYGDSSNSAWLDSRFRVWRHSTGAAVGYIPQNKLAIAIGDPLSDKTQYADVCTAFVNFAKSDLQITPVWMLVSDDVQALLARKLGWRTLTCTEEQRVDTSKHSRQNNKKKRKVNRAGVRMHETKADSKLMKRANPAIEKWKSCKSGKQMHITEVRPWDDIEHRRYFIAEKDDELLALVVLAQLSPSHGWQIKWALDFPGSMNGAIDALLDYVLSNTTEPLTFGVGPSDRLTPMARLRGIRAWLMAKSYHLTVQRLGLGHKSEFRSKFGITGEQVYICYPKGAIGPGNLRKLVNVFSG